MAWHENTKPALARAEKKRARRKFIVALLETSLSQEEKDKLIKLYDKGH